MAANWKQPWPCNSQRWFTPNNLKCYKILWGCGWLWKNMIFDWRWLPKMAANWKMTLSMLFAASSYPLRHKVLPKSSNDVAGYKARRFKGTSLPATVCFSWPMDFVPGQCYYDQFWYNSWARLRRTDCSGLCICCKPSNAHTMTQGTCWPPTSSLHDFYSQHLSS